MSSAATARKAALHTRLVEIAEARIAAEGSQALRARDLAREAGCSVGAIYNVFDDLNALVMAVNGRTFRALGAEVSAAVSAAEPCAAKDRLIVMSTAYLGFAAAHKNLWQALFDLEMTVDGDVPAWYLSELGHLFALISAPLREIFPDKTADELDLLVRALFSAVHGIVLLGLERRISGVPIDRIEAMIAAVLSEIGT